MNEETEETSETEKSGNVIGPFNLAKNLKEKKERNKRKQTTIKTNFEPPKENNQFPLGHLHPTALVFEMLKCDVSSSSERRNPKRMNANSMKKLAMDYVGNCRA